MVNSWLTVINHRRTLHDVYVRRADLRFAMPALLDFNNNAVMCFGLMALCTLIANSKSILASGHPPCK